MTQLVRRGKSQQQFTDAVIVGTKKGLNAWADLVRERAAHNAPVDQGELARSINKGEVSQIGEYSWMISVGTNLEYAAAQEFGSGLHSEDPDKRHKYPIEAGFWSGKSSSKSLAFLWPGGPGKASSAFDPDTGLYFFRKINHPGVRAQPYLRPALKDSSAEGRSLLLAAVVAELRAI